MHCISLLTGGFEDWALKLKLVNGLMGWLRDKPKYNRFYSLLFHVANYQNTPQFS